MKTENSFLTTNEAADILNISLSTLKKLIYQGRLKTFKTPGGHYRILKQDLLECCRKNAATHRHGREVSWEEKEENSFALSAFTVIVESRHRFCKNHAICVATICDRIADILSVSPAESKKLRNAALLHDIGMLAVPDSILNKETALSAGEYERLTAHPLLGAQILSRAGIFSEVIPIIIQHHERHDGSGYPYGLTGSSICREAKIISIAEAFMAMIAHDSYKDTMQLDNVCRELQDFSGSQFDPALVDMFIPHAQDIFQETVKVAHE